MAITLDGSTGIGTPSPVVITKAGDGNAELTVRATGTGDSDAQINIEATDTGEPTLDFKLDGTSVARLEVFSTNVYLRNFGAGLNIYGSLGNQLWKINDVEKMRLNETSLSVTAGTIKLNGNDITGMQVAIADDSFAALTFGNRSGGFISVIMSGDDFPQASYSQQSFVDFGTSPANFSAGYQGSQVVLRNDGPPTGTTGTDGKVTIFCGGTAGTLYIENRTGSVTNPRTFQITLL